MTNEIKNLAFVFLGGGLGSSIRYLISSLFILLRIKVWTATLLVNVVGASLMLLLSYKFNLSKDMSRFVQIGLLGGLTTFSTFSLEVVSSFRNGNYYETAAILGLNIVLGIIIGIGIFR